MIKPTPKNKFIFTLVLVSVITIILTGSSYYWGKKVKQLSYKITQRKTELEYIKSQVKSGKLAQDLAEVQKIEKEVEKVFLKNDPLTFITFLENLASNSNIEQKIEVLEKKSEEKSEIIKSLAFRLNLTGEFKNLLKYIQKLANQDFYINIESFNIQSGSPLKAYLEIKTYWITK